MRIVAIFAILCWFAGVASGQTLYRLGLSGGPGLAISSFNNPVNQGGDVQSAGLSYHMGINAFVYPSVHKSLWFIKTGGVMHRNNFGLDFDCRLIGFTSDSRMTFTHTLATYAWSVGGGKTLFYGKSGKTFMDICGSVQIGITQHVVARYDYTYGASSAQEQVFADITPVELSPGNQLALNLEVGATIAPFANFENLQFTLAINAAMLQGPAIESGGYFLNLSRNLEQTVYFSGRPRFVAVQFGMQFTFGSFHKRLVGSTGSPQKPDKTGVVE